MFTKDQLDRYARHIILPGVGAAGQQKLLNAKVLVIGAGGLGSPVLLYLAAAGVGASSEGALGICDFDVVDASNLQRQIIHANSTVDKAKTESAKARLEDLNPDSNIKIHETALDTSNARAIIRDYDLVIDGSDNFATRYLVNDACVLEQKALVYGAMSQFEGQVSLFHATTHDGEQGPCYRCLYAKPPPAGTVRSCSEAGVFGALPGVIGSLMAVEAIKHIAGLGESIAGKLLHYDALYSEFREVQIRRKVDCVVCGDEPTQTDLIDYENFCS